MQINKIKIKNFKLFKEEEFTFNSEFNLIVGINGSGKTSLLRAISVALGGWANAYINTESNLRPILDEEIREIQIDNRFDKTKETHIKAFGEAYIINSYNNLTHATAQWERYRKEGSIETYQDGAVKFNSSQFYNLNLDTIGSNTLNYIERGKRFNLPIIAFYECDRLWLAKNELNIEASAKAQYSRFDPYVDCFHTGSDHHAIAEWLLKHELTSLQQGKETPVLQAIKYASKMALEKCI